MQPPITLPDGTTADPGVILVMKTIKQMEGGNYNDRNGDGGSSAGAYQWNNDNVPLQPGENPSHWVAAAAKFLGDPKAPMTPDNQDEVAYKQIAAYKAQGYGPDEIDALWNSARKDPVTGKMTHVSADREARFQAALQNNLQEQQSGYNPKPFSQPDTTAKTDTPPPPAPDTTQTTGQSDNVFANTLPKVLTSGPSEQLVKGAGDFLFPIAGDIKNDFTGQSTKTPLQQTGDAALSILPFIPGFGEAGEGLRGVGLAGDTAAWLAAHPKTTGAAFGAGTGVAANLSQGKPFYDPTNIGAGAGLGFSAPAGMEAFGAARNKLSGVTPQMTNALAHPDINIARYNQYIQAAQERAQNIRAPAPFELAADKLDEASTKIKDAWSAAGETVGKAKQFASDVKLPDITPVIQDFKNRVANDYGISLTTDHTGQVETSLMPDRTAKISHTEVNRLGEVYQKLAGLLNSTARNGTDVIGFIDHSVDTAKSASNMVKDPLEGFLSHTRDLIDQQVRKVSPTLASANDSYSALSELRGEMAKMAGGANQRGELLMRRVFSGDKSGDVQNLFEKIKAVTGIDLINEAVLAKHAIESVGDPTQTSLLHQMISSAVEGGPPTIPGMALGAARAIARHTFANPIKIGAEAVSGSGLSRFVSPFVTPAAIESSRGINSLIPTLHSTQQ